MLLNFRTKKAGHAQKTILRHTGHLTINRSLILNLLSRNPGASRRYIAGENFSTGKNPVHILCENHLLIPRLKVTLLVSTVLQYLSLVN